MFEIEWIVAASAVLWSALLLLGQFFIARGKGRSDFSVQAGSPIKAIIYNFTIAMLPSHKETVRLHFVKFLIGITMHIGAMLALVKTLIMLAYPEYQPIIPLIAVIVFGISALCGLYLFVRRFLSPNLKAMSFFDDYLSILMTIGICVFAGLHEWALVSTSVYFIASSVLLFYLPLGKLRHAIFFFIARADYGKRLGFRGVYPATSGSKE